MAFSFEAALDKADLFAKVEPDHLSSFAEVASPQTYNDGQTITHQGDLGTGLYVITKGGADVTITDAMGYDLIGTVVECESPGDIKLLSVDPAEV